MTQNKRMGKSDGGYDAGIATIQKNDTGTKVRVTIHATDKEPERVYVLNRKDCPEFLLTGDFSVNINRAKKTMTSIHPVSGMYEVKTVKFISEENKPPAPKTHPGGMYEPYDYFTVLFEIVRGAEKGMQLTCRFRYYFEEKNKATVLSHTPKSKYHVMLDEYLAVTGAMNKGQIKYSDNVLPEIERRILREDQSFMVLLENGFVSKFMPKLENEPEVEKTE